MNHVQNTGSADNAPPMPLLVTDGLDFIDKLHQDDAVAEAQSGGAIFEYGRDTPELRQRNSAILAYHAEQRRKCMREIKAACNATANKRLAGYARNSIDGIIKDVERVQNGPKWNPTLYVKSGRMAGWAEAGFIDDESDAKAALLEAAAPWNAKEERAAKATIKSGWGKPIPPKVPTDILENRKGTRAETPSKAEKLNETRSPAASSETASDTAPSGLDLLLDRKVNGAALDAKHFDPLHYQIDRLVPEGLGMLVAPPKKGKSFLVLDFGLAVADGTKALCRIPVVKRPVLYLALEDGERRLQDRSRMLLEDDSIPDGIDFITRAKPAEAMLIIEAFMTEHRDEKPFVIVDTLAKVKRHKLPGEEAYLVDYEAGDKLRKLVDIAPGSTLLVVHHSRKAEVADFIDAASGTYGLVGSVDFVMVLKRERLSDNAILAVTGRDVIEGEYALRADHGYMWRLDGDDLKAAANAVEQRRAENKMGDRKYELYEFVCSQDDPVTPSQVAQAMGIDNDTAGKYLRRLVADGVVIKAGRGKFMRNPKVVPRK